MATKRDALAFIGAIAQGRGALTVDSEGEFTLKIAGPASEAARVMEAFPKLIDQELMIVITRRKDAN